MPIKPLMRRRDSATRGRHLVAENHIAKGQLIFCERPMIALQSTGNAFSGALCCHYCMAFVGKPEHALEIAANPMVLPEITTKDHPEDQKEVGDGHALIPCRNKCGLVYCSIECQQDDWEWGGHKKLCTGWIEDLDHPLLKFKHHSVETNEIFLLIAQWLTRIHNQHVPYNEDDSLNTHPYTDFMMNPWWDVATLPLVKDPLAADEATELENSCKRLCKESHSFLQEAWPEQESQWLTPLGMARLIGSLEQNCVGVRRKHPLRINVLEDTELRHSHHTEVIKCLEKAGMIGPGAEEEDEGEENQEEEDGASKDQPNSVDALDEHDKSVESEEQFDYSFDEIAEFLSNLSSPLNIGSDDDWDEIFSPLDGTAHFSLLTKMNHSCSPNSVVLYKGRGWGRDHPLCAYCIALKDIAPGEELTISYIETDESYEERQAALANYGFQCTCPKCEMEKNNPQGTPHEDAIEEEDNLFGSEDDNEDNNSKEDDINDLFGNDDDDYDEISAAEDELDGETKLQNAAERFESFLNKSINGAIPLKYLAPVSAYIIKLCHAIQKETNNDASLKVVNNLLSKCIEGVQERDFSLCRVVGPDLELCLYQQLRDTGSWPSTLYRQAYWCACITTAIGHAQDGSFLVAIKALDKAIIMGQERKAIEDFFSYVEIHAFQMAASPCPPAIECKVADYLDPDVRKALISIGLSKELRYPVNEVSIHADEFVASLPKLTEPAVFRSFGKSWPAVTKWRNIETMARNHGHRLVPIEIGSMDSGMKEELVSFRSFVSDFLSGSSKQICTSLGEINGTTSKIAYLAQHPLLDQIPSLYEDVPNMPYGLRPTNVNIWLGTGGTRTPLHFDSYDNLFVQLVGAKYVRLYDTDQTDKLYVSKDGNYGLQGNMSKVNCELEDFDSHPLAKDCQYTEVLLLPGDCLFIPSRHWHYVRSLSTSISINYWF